MTHPFRTVSAALALAASSLLIGCPGEEQSCGEVDSFSAEGCGAGLDQVVREGVWHGLVTSDGGTVTRRQLAYLSFNGEDGAPMVHGLANSEGDFDGKFFVTGDAIVDGQRIRHAYSACQAPDPQTLVGDYQVCLNGTLRGTGTFELRRIGRPEGESEALGLERVGEIAVVQGTARDVAVHNGRAYVAAEDGLVTIFDVSDPTRPRPLADLGVPTGEISIDDPDLWYDVEIFENVLFVGGQPRGVRAYDLSTGSLIPVHRASMPAQPRAVRSISIDPVARRLLANTLAGEVLIFDINTPTSPVLIGSFLASNLGNFPGAYPRATATRGDRLYCAFGPMGLVVADIAQPSAPAQVAAPFLPDSAFTNSLQLIEDAASLLAYEVAEGWGGHLRVVDMTTPSTAAVVSEFQTRPHVSASQVVIRGTRAYLAYFQDGVRVLDLSSPRAPAQVAYFDTHDDTRPGAGARYLEGAVGVFPATDDSGLVYVADTERGLIILRETP